MQIEFLLKLLILVHKEKITGRESEWSRNEVGREVHLSHVVAR